MTRECSTEKVIGMNKVVMSQSSLGTSFSLHLSAEERYPSASSSTHGRKPQVVFCF